MTAYKQRIDSAGRRGDLEELAKLIAEGAEGSRLLTDDEVGRLTGALRRVARRHLAVKAALAVSLIASVVLSALF